MANFNGSDLGFTALPAANTAAPSVNAGDLGFAPVAAPTDPNSYASQGEALARGAEQGATFGFGDEINGGLEALKDKLTGDNNTAGLMDLYRKHRDESREAFKQSESAHPFLNFAGNIAGGMVTTGGALKALGGLGVLGANAVHGTEAYNALSGMDKIKNAAKVGTALGAIGGVGNSEADLTQGDVVGTAKDAIDGAALGAAVGGGIQTLGNVAGTLGGIAKKNLSAFGDLGPIHDIKDAANLSYGVKGSPSAGLLERIENTKLVLNDAINAGESSPKQIQSLQDQLTSLQDQATKASNTRAPGISLVGKANREKIVQAGDDAITDLTNKLNAGLSTIGKLKEAKLDDATSKGVIVNIQNEAKEFLNEINSLPDTLDIEKSEKQKLLNLAQKVLQGDPQATEQPKIVKTGEATTPRQQLLDKTEPELIKADALGIPLQRSIKEGVDSQGRKWLSPVFTTDENIGGSEQMVPGEPTLSQNETPTMKVRSSYENTPENKTKAVAQAAKLNAQEQLKGGNSQFNVNDDIDKGFYHVVEHGKKVEVVSTPGEPQMVSGDNMKSTARVGTPMMIEPGFHPDAAYTPVESQMVPGTDTNQGKFLDNVKNIDQLKQSVQSAAFDKDYNSGQAKRFIQQFATGLKQKVEQPFENQTVTDNLGTPIYQRDPNNPFQYLKDADGNPVPRVENPIRELNQQYQSGLAAKDMVPSIEHLHQLGSESATSDIAKLDNNEFMGLLHKMVKGTGYNQGDDIIAAGEKVKDQAKQLGLVHKMSQPGINGLFGAKAGMLNVSSAVGSVARDITNATPDSIKAMASMVARGATTAHKEVANAINTMATKDQAGRNAMMFALSQNPAYRQVLKDYVPGVAGVSDTQK
jgi:hypothetical protein